MPLKDLKKYAFWILSRSGLAIYSRLPIFGTLRVALGVIRNQNYFLMIERADGRGLSFPGGIAMPWENLEKTAQREILEETGLRAIRQTFKLRYSDPDDVPVDISVFEVEAEGRLRDSWEGTPRWVELAEMRQRVLRGQKRIVELLAQP
jgi:8-oxo-dGTP pyrophosphatase MutT (NUDIX family)